MRPVDDDRLLRGEGRFSDDLRLDRQLVGVFVRSVHAHARIRMISIEGLSPPEASLLFLPPRISRRRASATSRGRGPREGRNGRELIVPHRPALARNRVVHVGEPIVLVVADTLTAALDAVELVAVDYEPMPAVAVAVDALAADAPEIWPEAPGNLSARLALPVKCRERRPSCGDHSGRSACGSYPGGQSADRRRAAGGAGRDRGL